MSTHHSVVTTGRSCGVSAQPLAVWLRVPAPWTGRYGVLGILSVSSRLVSLFPLLHDLISVPCPRRHDPLAPFESTVGSDWEQRDWEQRHRATHGEYTTNQATNSDSTIGIVFLVLGYLPHCVLLVLPVVPAPRHRVRC